MLFRLLLFKKSGNNSKYTTVIVTIINKVVGFKILIRFFHTIKIFQLIFKEAFKPQSIVNKSNYHFAKRKDARYSIHTYTVVRPCCCQEKSPHHFSTQLTSKTWTRQTKKTITFPEKSRNWHRQQQSYTILICSTLNTLLIVQPVIDDCDINETSQRNYAASSRSSRQSENQYTFVPNKHRQYSSEAMLMC